MATIRIDEVNIPQSFDAEQFIREYFKPMRISKERKEIREEAARDFRDFLLFILALIATESAYNVLNWAYIEEQFRREMEQRALEYARRSQALEDYIAEKASDFTSVTRDKDLSDPYWTSDERATMEAVNEANSVIGMEEWQKAIDAGAVEKRWRTQRDEIVRESHRAVDGHKEAINSFFVLKRGIVRFPGDEYYCKAESVRCRCGLEFLDKDGNVVGIYWTKRRKKVNKTDEKVQFTDSENHSTISTESNLPETIRLDDILFHKSVGAAFRRYEVLDLVTGEFHYTADRITNVEVFAGKGTRKKYKKAWKFAERYGGREEDWQHVKGVTILETEDGYRKAEVHWSQCEGYGKQEFFVKKWLDD